jgi:DNA helicase HerA-like ATPase
LGSVSKVQGDSVSFYLNKENTVSFGQMVKINSGERSFYARVVNAQSSSTLETGEQLREAQGKETFGPYSSYKSIEAILFLEKQKGRIRSPTFNPNYMDKVVATTVEDCNALRLEGELEIGRLRSGEDVLGSVGINIDAIPYMIGMFGMTGSGKTNCELVLNAQIIDHSPRTVGIIFDFAGQLLEGKGIKPQKGIRDHPLFHTKVSYYSTKGDKMKIGLHTLTPSKLQTLFPEVGYAQFRLAQKLYKLLGDAWIERSLEIFVSGGYKELGNKIGYGQKSAIEALMMKLQHLSPEIFPPSNYNFVDSVIENVSQGITCLIDISGLTAEEQHRVVTLTALNVAQYYKKTWESDHETWQKLPTLLVTLEEAHEFLDPSKPKTIFSDIALTYRKYRVGLNAVTPRPSKINYDVFAELWTKVIMKTELKKDREYLTENTPYMEYSDTEIKMLDIGEALLISEPKIRFAVPIKATHYPEYLDNKKPADYDLPASQPHSKMDERLKLIRKATDKTLTP